MQIEVLQDVIIKNCPHDSELLGQWQNQYPEHTLPGSVLDSCH